jgi:hypothetical protein
MKKPKTVQALETLGRVRLSTHFQMREFLYSEIAQMNGLANVPDDPELAIAAGTKLCEELLEPITERWGRIIIRSAYRSPEVNALGNENDWSCARNEANYAGHIWDKRDAEGHMGATTTIVVPGFLERVAEDGGWQRLAWWIHDTLPYHSLYFFPKDWAFNISWHENPTRRIDSYVSPRGCLTKPGMENWNGPHDTWYRDLT